MSPFFFKLFVLLFILPTCLPAQMPLPCGAEPSESSLDYLFRTRHERTHQTMDIGARANNTKVVRVQVHIIQKSDGSNGADYSEIIAALDAANDAYAGANIVLQQCGFPNVISSNKYATFNKYTDETIRDENDAAGAINIYFADKVKSGSSEICGYAHFPEDNVAGTYTGFTVVANQCIEASLIHELGHCFGLLHTHETSYGKELVTRGAGANCSSAGDLMCDTPADPKLTQRDSQGRLYYIVDNNCNYTGSLTDANGWSYSPDTRNYMAYTVKACRSQFSADQLSAVSYSGNNDYPNTVCVTACNYGGINSFPYFQSFEDPILLTDLWMLPKIWQQDLYDDGNWTMHSGSTPSTLTGPSAAYDGNFYLYTEASSTYHKDFGLVSPCFDFSGRTWGRVGFRYHMYGSAMGALKLEISTDGGDNWSQVWTLSGNQGNSWQEANVNLDAYAGQESVRFRFLATTGASFRSDICIDAFKVDAGPYYTRLPYFTGFDDGSLDKYWETSSSNSAGRIRVTSDHEPVGSHHVAMDVRYNGTMATNELRLGVKMGNVEGAVLTFLWKEFNDESHDEDGVYLSDDGGATFTKVYSMTGAQLNTWVPVILPISNLATALGLERNDEFVIKWQQKGFRSMTTDGIAVDMVQLIPGSSNDVDIEALAAEANAALEAERDAPITCYPNPFLETFTLDIPHRLGVIQTIQVINLNGQIFHQQNSLPAGQQLELGRELPAGIYFIRVQTEQSLQTVKMIKTGE